MLAQELREKYLQFFESKGHRRLPSDSLVPNDPSLLFTSAGMVQFKPYFLGLATPPHTRVTTVQKCLRTTDIESVGDHSHLTFFEMLGNFSFGDYFKAEVIPWTWEFLTEWLKIDPDRLCATIFLDDDEAFDIWNRVVGLPADRIHRLGEDKNYWPANAISEGPNGPCGPCTEVFYRVAPLEEMTTDPSLTPTERFKIDEGAGRWLEIWNNVFTQYDRQEDDHGRPILVPLPKKNNDTGAGLDRNLMVVQGKRSVFETDLFLPILHRVEELAGRAYGGTMEPVDFAFRVVAEHTRAMVFCIADGILPSNEGRGYVLRRIMRRAIRFGRTVLGFEEPFLYEVAPKVIERMGGFYHELVERQEHILRTIRAEEERFGRTLDNGMNRLAELLDRIESSGKEKILSGADAFTLYDTYGFPLELTQEIAAERGIQVDLEAFGVAMEEQRRRSQEASHIHDALFRSVGAALAELQRTLSPTEFLGYSQLCAEATVLAIIKGGELVDFARAGDEVEIVLDRTPFYAEAGGQVGDTGEIFAPATDTQCAVRIAVTDTQKAGGIYLHSARVLEGELCTDMLVHTAVDAERRRHILRNHTATHLLHAALRRILGAHVHQKGSLVAPDRLRFDFTHTQPMTPDEVRQVEEMVNAHILADEEVLVHTDVPFAEAKARGAMALFGEKYGDRVRMIEIPGFSLELCGGTHLSRTSQAALFKITHETGIAAGVRRIEAVTGAEAYRYVEETEKNLAEIARLLKTNLHDVLPAVERLVQQRAQLEKQLHQLRTGAVATGNLAVQEMKGVRIITGPVAHADPEALAALADRTVQQHREGTIVVVGAVSDGKVFFAAKVTPDLVRRGFHAGDLVREVAKIAGGGGGGRPD
ncbi:MAG TPA: alanine--tRNA ligase, partial [Chthonomonadales bacterium]|nr:alanine--tRNA ligase [Chthonomonadales bacterium]